MTNTLGLYIHIPFCIKKCNYCDFYSVTPTDDMRRGYVESICRELEKWGGRQSRPIDTVYIGGGTPSLLTERELDLIMTAVRESFCILPGAEITAEINPGDQTELFLSSAKKAGVNRISVGVQSADEKELARLGRRHTFADAVHTVKTARRLGFDNISADIMIGLPDSDEKSLQKSLEGILSLDTEHISAYILKVEEGTPFAKAGLSLPDEDGIADQYLQMCRFFENAGYEHYEISNFARPGFQSRHNNRYWLDEEYIGIGPGAHSFCDRKRSYYPKDIRAFIEKGETVGDGEGGGREEFIMLALRLSRGLVFSEYEDRFGAILPDGFFKKASLFQKGGLVVKDREHVALTDTGMLVSNTIISEFIGELYEDI